MLKLMRKHVTISSTIKNSIRCLAAKKEKPTEKENPVNNDAINKSETKIITKAQFNGIKNTSFQKTGDYLKSIGSEDLISHMPQYLLKAVKTPRNLYLVDRNIAKKISNLIQDSFTSNPDTFIAEVHPGLGLLTENLLKTSIPKIHIYEPLQAFIQPNSRLMRMLNDNKDRLELRTKNLLQMWNFTFQDRQSGTRNMEDLLKGIKERKWTEKPYMTVFGTSTNDSFFKQLIMSVIFKNTIVQNGRITFYVMVSPLNWQKFTSSKNTAFYKSRSILFQTLFNYEQIETFPRQAFLPWSSENNKNKACNRWRHFKELGVESLHLVKIEPKIDLHDRFSESELLLYFYFIKHHLQKRHSKIIPALEQWIPGCGEKLTKLGFTIDSEFEELNPEQLLKLYREFISWPEFEACYFSTSATMFFNSLEDAFAEMGYV